MSEAAGNNTSAPDDDKRKDLLHLLTLQRNIKRVEAARWDANVDNFLDEIFKFVNKHRPASFNIKTDDNGNPDVSFVWSTPVTGISKQPETT